MFITVSNMPVYPANHVQFVLSSDYTKKPHRVSDPGYLCMSACCAVLPRNTFLWLCDMAVFKTGLDKQLSGRALVPESTRL